MSKSKCNKCIWGDICNNDISENNNRKCEYFTPFEDEPDTLYYERILIENAQEYHWNCEKEYS